MQIKQFQQIPDNTAYKIPVNNRLFALVDKDDYERFSLFHWRLRQSGHCSYVSRRVTENGKTHIIYLHREIAKTPKGFDCHHKNHNTLDCRKKNLQNLSPNEHHTIHKEKIYK